MTNDRFAGAPGKKKTESDIISEVASVSMDNNPLVRGGGGGLGFDDAFPRFFPLALPL